ncbi:hypothetical protein [Stenotrophomonas sp. BIO128-Bstrain]|jgi:hypothetical protein|uniref:hypothetical protein n=1 Tax=Stenotrophomonas sp. BIO128-Bstrain TaxID=3027225 RepID=UPI0024DEDDC1|nr:hypothetical protein [Stenotrophomonas sp. BIO128-Bstrain]WIA61367.1 hypothetical protein POS15_18850 [Stenotrophomonas sp. BIO128-Bstrain]
MNGSHLNCLIGNDDEVMHDLFSATRQLLRIYELPVSSLMALTDVLEQRPGAFEELTVRELLAMAASVQVAA